MTRTLAAVRQSRSGLPPTIQQTAGTLISMHSYAPLMTHCTARKQAAGIEWTPHSPEVWNDGITSNA
jgi:hypothetical protein